MTEDVARAKRFELVDDEGNVRAVLTPGPEKSVGLSLFDEEDETERVAFGINAGGTSFAELRNGDGEGGLRLAVEKGGTTVLRIRDRHGEERANLAFSPQDAKNNPGSLGIAFADENGNLRAQFGISPDGDANIVLYDKNGTEAGSLVSSDRIGTGFNINDSQGTPRAGILVEKDGIPKIVLLDESGEVFWGEKG